MALRAPGLVVAQQLLVGVATVLPAAVGVNDEFKGRRLGQKARCKAVVSNSSGIVAATCQPSTYWLATS
ncbi:hypothetical protein DDQ68_03890 [Hymenobacter nivis]|uniref:Uncharacterized protein n=1 Tax=Hymenobacter nivis TaxID=1850093 RepID=A0A2Z3GTI7_9BACT|nr:hypothetical protein DDQ68_03890 [Hymenobacter nivis]